MADLKCQEEIISELQLQPCFNSTTVLIQRDSTTVVITRTTIVML